MINSFFLLKLKNSSFGRIIKPDGKLFVEIVNYDICPGKQFANISEA